MGKTPLEMGVERTLSWLNHSRRLSKDYEISISSAETMVIISQNLYSQEERAVIE